MYYHVATDVKRCVLRGGKDDDFLGPGPAAGKPACRAGLAGAAPPPFFLAGLAGLRRHKKYRRHAEIFDFLNTV